MKKNSIMEKVIAVYFVEKVLGGHEEGGWHYYHYYLDAVFPFSRKLKEELKNILPTNYEMYVEYNGGGEHTTETAPIYE